MIRYFERFLLKNPRQVLVFVVLFLLLTLFYATRFQLDASSDTLLNENDRDFRVAVEVSDRYALTDTIVLVYRSTGPLFTTEELARLKELRSKISKVSGVKQITSLLDVPLLEQGLFEKGDKSSLYSTVLEPGISLSKARLAFQYSPLYRNLLLSEDTQTTGMEIELHESVKRSEHHEIFQTIRMIMATYAPFADLHLGGLDVISDDMVMFIRKDLSVFGVGVLVCMVAVLWAIFGRKRWIFLSILACASACVAMMGILGFLGWKVTVISSNFVSLQIILTLSLVIHLIVKYRELAFRFPDKTQYWLVRQTVHQKLTPSLFAVFTTVTGFGSLVLSAIKPVESFGWMMIAGLIVSLILTFLLFVVYMLRVDRYADPCPRQFGVSFIRMLATITDRYRHYVLVVGIVAVFLGGVGMFKLKVENSFINYFKKHTEVFQSLSFIDRNLGGTIPLDIIIRLPDDSSQEVADDEAGDEDFDFFEDEESKDEASYWLSLEKVELAKKVHDYLDGLSETGKVLSLWTTVQVAQKVTGGPLDNFELALLYQLFPEDLKKTLLDPYASIEHNELRLTVRMMDSNPDLRRDLFLKQVAYDLEHELGLEKDQFSLVGTMVLYNNMLQSLFSSQILTLGLVLVALTAMLLLLFRCVRLALIAIIPSMVSVVLVLGIMGWLGIPLDMMTITIAAITVGIGVDDAIHYIYRFRKELVKDHDYVGAMYRSHESIGCAMLYTTLTIGLGFGILIFSNFIPNVMFGLLTALAMVLALLGSLTLMSLSLILWKPTLRRS